ncbi:MAG TPA: hypothetical protein PLT35_08635, partial [Vicinamibacterales bacterium]|nr:hypothetical protein [Vicinamibacterales bacterium]
MPQIELTELTLPELEDAFAQLGLERYRARQVFQWVYRRGACDFDLMTSLPAAHRRLLAARFRVSTPSIARRDVSADGTEKFLL